MVPTNFRVHRRSLSPSLVVPVTLQASESPTLFGETHAHASGSAQPLCLAPPEKIPKENLMKTRVICIVLIVLTMGLFAVAQETANSYTSDASSQVKTLDYVAKFITAKGGLGNSRIFDNGTNVGIGTAAPAATLDVNGTVNAATSFNLQGNPFVFGSYGNGNVFLGFAGNVTTTGSNNTATGQGALASNTTGAFNTANGLQALFFNTTGDYNVASGEGALTSNTTGSENTASGYGALVYNTTGGYNTATGFFALWANNGSNNTANGSWALTYNTTGTYNAGDGAYALYSNT